MVLTALSKRRPLIAIALSLGVLLFTLSSYSSLENDSAEPAERQAQRVTLEMLDRTLVKANGLDEFLANETIQTEYFTLLKQYFQFGDDEFDKPTQEVFLNQLKLAADNVTGFKERIWQTTGTGSAHKIHVDDNAFQAENYTAFLDQWSKKLEMSASAHPSLDSARAKAAIMNAERRLTETIDAAASGPRKARDAAQGTAFRVLREDKIARAAVAQTALEILKASGGLDQLRACQVPTCAKFVLENTRDQIRAKIGDSSAVEALVDQLQLKADKFASRTNAVVNLRKLAVATLTGRDLVNGTYEFNPAPRRFHTIFKGIKAKECVGGCSKNLASLTPERWATALLDDAEFYFIESGGAYAGSVQLVPIKRSADGKIFASVDTTSYLFSNEVVTKLKNGTPAGETFFQSWLKEYHKHKPKSWQGVISGQSFGADNFGSPSVYRGSSSYIFGSDVGTADEFAFLDNTFASELNGLVPRNTWQQRRYGGQMIFDASIKNSGTLRELNVLAPTDAVFDVRKLKEDLGLAGEKKYLDTLLRYFVLLPRNAELDAFIDTEMKGLSKESSRTFFRELAIAMSKGQTPRAVSRLSAGHLTFERFAMMSKHAKEFAKEQKNDDLFGQFTLNARTPVANLDLSWENVKRLPALGVEEDTMLAIRRSFLRTKTSSLVDIQQYIEPISSSEAEETNLNTLRVEFREKARAAIHATFGTDFDTIRVREKIRKRYPIGVLNMFTDSFAKEIAEQAAFGAELSPFMRFTTSADAMLRFHQRKFELAKTAEELIDARRIYVQDPTSGYLDAVDKMASTQLSRFFDSSPDRRAIATLLSTPVSQAFAQNVLEQAFSRGIIRNYNDLAFIAKLSKFTERTSSQGAFKGFLAIHPSIFLTEQNLDEVLSIAGDYGDDVQIRTNFIAGRRDKLPLSSILTVLDYGQFKEDSAWTAGINKLYGELTRRFFERQPTKDQIKQLLSQARTVEQSVFLRDHALQFATTTDQYFTALDVAQTIDKPSDKILAETAKLALKYAKNFSKVAETPAQIQALVKLVDEQTEKQILAIALETNPNLFSLDHFNCSHMFGRLVLQ